MKTFFKILGLCLLLVACNKQTKPKTAHVYEVKPQALHKSLHFTGTVQPLHESTLVSPMEAVLEEMHVHYGQRVKKGDLIFSLNSNELQKKYNDTLTEYLKAKDSYSIAKTKFSGTQDLWQSGLLAKNNYLSEQSSMNTMRISLMQARRKLMELLNQIDEDNAAKLSSLSLSDFEQLKNILATKHNIIHLKAPSNGVMLYPPKSQEDKENRIRVGSLVKSGQVLAILGDLTGICVEIDIPEIDVDKIHPGMDALISGVAFGKHQLKGRLVALNAQASSNSNGGLPSFTALVEVQALSPEEQAWIKVGMSAAIELKTQRQNQLLIPIAAVKREQGRSVVHVQLAENKLIKRSITTGAAEADSVVVESGLKVGEKVVYD